MLACKTLGAFSHSKPLYAGTELHCGDFPAMLVLFHYGKPGERTEVLGLFCEAELDDCTVHT